MSGIERVTPEMYSRVFEGSPEGQLVYQHLVERFCRNPYVKGGLEGDRQTAYNAGASSVLSFVTSQINRSNGFNEPLEPPPGTESLELTEDNPP